MGRRHAGRARWGRRLVGWGAATGVAAVLALSPTWGEASSRGAANESSSGPEAAQVLAGPATVLSLHRAHRTWTPDPLDRTRAQVLRLNARASSVALADGQPPFVAELQPTGRVAVHLAAPLGFAPASADIPPQADPALDSLAQALNTPALRHLQVRVIGHADARGPQGSNASLSFSRAEQVALALAARGVHGDRLRLHAAGESDPEASNARATGRAANRRVELQLLDPGLR